MVTVVQLVRASDCGSECRGFESLQSPPQKEEIQNEFPLFLCTRLLRYRGHSPKKKRRYVA